MRDTRGRAVFMKVVPDPVGPGQESVWSYPRPAVAQPCGRLLEIVHRGIVVARTRRGVRTLETSHPPSYYFPREDVAIRCCGLRRGGRSANGRARRSISTSSWRTRLSPTPPGAIRTRAPLSRACAITSRSIRPLRRMLYRRRARAPAERRVLWRLDHVPRRGSLQGSAGDDGLVTGPAPEKPGCTTIAASPLPV